jgi:hypothetical protein
MFKIFERSSSGGSHLYHIGTKTELIAKLEEHYKINLSNIDIEETPEEVYQRIRTEKVLNFDANKMTAKFIEDKEEESDDESDKGNVLDFTLNLNKRRNAEKDKKLIVKNEPFVTGNVAVNVDVSGDEEIDELGKYFKNLR